MSTAASTYPLWGQAWSLDVVYSPSGGDQQTLSIAYNDWQPEALRVTFEVLQSAISAPMWYADINIYNLDSKTQQNLLISTDTQITLKAGFQSGSNISSIIWKGPVFQTIYTRENVVDQRLTLHCAALPPGSELPVAFSMGPNTSQQWLLARMAQANNLPPMTVEQGTVDATSAQRLAAVTYPRGNTIFAKPAKLTDQLADTNFLQSFTDGKQLYMTAPDDGNRVPSLTYAPPFPPEYSYIGNDVPDGTTHSIIGTPQQIPEGVIFTVLLDPRVRVGVPAQLVQLVRTNINALTVTPGPDSGLPPLLGPDGSNLTFFVKQVRHTGDSRGNDWQTEITGWSTGYAQTLLGLLGGLNG